MINKNNFLYEWRDVLPNIFDYTTTNTKESRKLADVCQIFREVIQEFTLPKQLAAYQYCESLSIAHVLYLSQFCGKHLEKLDLTYRSSNDLSSVGKKCQKLETLIISSSTSKFEEILTSIPSLRTLTLESIGEPLDYRILTLDETLLSNFTKSKLDKLITGNFQLEKKIDVIDKTTKVYITCKQLEFDCNYLTAVTFTDTYELDMRWNDHRSEWEGDFCAYIKDGDIKKRVTNDNITICQFPHIEGSEDFDIDYDPFKVFLSFKNITSLYIPVSNNCDLDVIGFKKSQYKLKFLELGYDPKFEILEELLNCDVCKNLESLCLYGTSDFDEDSLRLIGKTLPNLKHLTIRSIHFKKVVFGELNQNPSLLQNLEKFTYHFSRNNSWVDERSIEKEDQEEYHNFVTNEGPSIVEALSMSRPSLFLDIEIEKMDKEETLLIYKGNYADNTEKKRTFSKGFEKVKKMKMSYQD